MDHDRTTGGPTAAVIGAGPAGLMAAERLARASVAVTVHDAMPSVARKLLLAGRGGLNLTHSEPTDRFLGRYGQARETIEPALQAFPAEALRAWCAELGVDTFVGSSGRVFPKAMKASPLLRAWLRRLDALGVSFALRRRWTGFSADGGLSFDGQAGETQIIRPGAAVFALGGASWPRLGADGSWTEAFAELGVEITKLEPANCGFRVNWSAPFASRFQGAPLKRVALDFEGRRVRGEALITASGIEGGMIYALSAALREAIARDGSALAALDLRPDLTVEALAGRLSSPRGKRSFSTHLAKVAALPPAAIGLIREAGAPPDDPFVLARLIKSLPLRLDAPFGLERAISTAGGVRLDEVDEGFMLKRRPGVFVAGEMLDWEAPTGGYLLHACLATGRAAGDAAAARLAQGAGGLAPILDSTSRGMSY